MTVIIMRASPGRREISIAVRAGGEGLNQANEGLRNALEALKQRLDQQEKAK